MRRRLSSKSQDEVERVNRALRRESNGETSKGASSPTSRVVTAAASPSGSPVGSPLHRTHFTGGVRRASSGAAPTANTSSMASLSSPSKGAGGAALRSPAANGLKLKRRGSVISSEEVSRSGSRAAGTAVGTSPSSPSHRAVGGGGDKVTKPSAAAAWTGTALQQKKAMTPRQQQQHNQRALRDVYVAGKARHVRSSSGAMGRSGGGGSSAGTGGGSGGAGGFGSSSGVAVIGGLSFGPRIMTPTVHVRVRPTVRYLGESGDARCVWFLDHENLVVQPTRRLAGGGATTARAVATSMSPSNSIFFSNTPPIASLTGPTTLTGGAAGLVSSAAMSRTNSEPSRLGGGSERSSTSGIPSRSLSPRGNTFQALNMGTANSGNVNAASKSSRSTSRRAVKLTTFLRNSHDGAAAPSSFLADNAPSPTGLGRDSRAATTPGVSGGRGGGKHSTSPQARLNGSKRGTPRVGLSITPLNARVNSAQFQQLQQQQSQHAVQTCSPAVDDVVPTAGTSNATGGDQHFTFELVHSESATQEEVFEESVLRFADEALLAQNVAILCYGPTGSGKTYSMMGSQTRRSGGSKAKVHGHKFGAASTTVTAMGAGSIRGRKRGATFTIGSSSSSAGVGCAGRHGTRLSSAASDDGTLSDGDEDRRDYSHYEDDEDDDFQTYASSPSDSNCSSEEEEEEGEEGEDVNRTWREKRERSRSRHLHGEQEAAAAEMDAASMGILPRLVHVLLDRCGETITLNSGSESIGAPSLPTGGHTQLAEEGNHSTNGARAEESSMKEKQPRRVLLTLRTLTFYGIEIYVDELSDLLDPAKRPITAMGDTGGLAALCQRLDQAREENSSSTLNNNNNNNANNSGNAGGRGGVDGTTRGAAAAGGILRQRGGGSGGGMPIKSVEDLRRAYRLACKNRVTSAHLKNDTSSRSHAVFILQLGFELVDHHGSNQQVRQVSSYVAMVDLAGCERIKETQVEGAALREAQYINKSLSALSSVVLSLYKRSSHIPYRDSKLTRLLRPCLEGGRVLLLVHVSPCSSGDTINSLKFGDQLRHTMVQTHRFWEGSKRDLHDIFEDLIDPAQGQLEEALQNAHHEYKLLCAEVRFAYLARYPSLVLDDKPPNQTIPLLVTSPQESPEKEESQGTNQSGAVVADASNDALLRNTLRSYAIRNLVYSHTRHYRRRDDTADMQEAIRRIERDRDRKVEAVKKKVSQQIAKAEAALSELTHFNEQLALENTTPLPQDPYSLELTRQLRETAEELNDIVKDRWAVSSIVTTLKQRLAARVELEAYIEAEVTELAQRNRVLRRLESHRRCKRGAATALSADGAGVGDSEAKGNDARDGGHDPSIEASLVFCRSASYVDAQIATDAEMREIAHQQVLLAKEMAALRFETACFDMGDTVWEGLWCRAMRQELLVAMKAEQAIMESILLDKRALHSLLVDAPPPRGDDESKPFSMGGSAQTCTSNNLSTLEKEEALMRERIATYMNTIGTRDFLRQQLYPENLEQGGLCAHRDDIESLVQCQSPLLGASATPSMATDDAHHFDGEADRKTPDRGRSSLLLNHRPLLHLHPQQQPDLGIRHKRGSVPHTNSFRRTQEMLSGGSLDIPGTPPPHARNPLDCFVEGNREGSPGFTSLARLMSSTLDDRLTNSSGMAVLPPPTTRTGSRTPAGASTSVPFGTQTGRGTTLPPQLLRPPISLVDSYADEECLQRASLRKLMEEGIPCEVCCIAADFNTVHSLFLCPESHTRRSARSTADNAVGVSGADDEGPKAGVNDRSYTNEDGDEESEVDVSDYSNEEDESSGGAAAGVDERESRGSEKSQTKHHTSEGDTPSPLVTIRWGRLRLRQRRHKHHTSSGETTSTKSYILELVYSSEGIPSVRNAPAISGSASPLNVILPPATMTAGGRRVTLEELVNSLPASLNIRRGYTPPATPPPSLQQPTNARPRDRRLFSIPLQEPQLSVHAHVLEAGSVYCAPRLVSGGGNTPRSAAGGSACGITTGHARPVRERTPCAQLALEVQGIPLATQTAGGRSSTATGASLSGSRAAATSALHRHHRGDGAAIQEEQQPDIVLAKKLSSGGELLLPSSCILPNTSGTCTLLLRFPAHTLAPSTRLESIEAIVAALCAVMVPGTGSGSSGSGGGGGALMPRVEREMHYGEISTVVCPLSHVPYALLFPDLVEGCDIKEPEENVGGEGSLSRSRSQPGMKDVKHGDPEGPAEFALPCPRVDPAFSTDTFVVATDALSISIGGLQQQHQQPLRSRCTVENAVTAVSSATLQVHVHLPGTLADLAGPPESEESEEEGGDEVGDGGVKEIALKQAMAGETESDSLQLRQARLAALLLQQLRSVTIGPRDAAHTCRSVFASSSVREWVNTTDTHPPFTIPADEATAMRLHQLQSFRHNIRGLVKQQIYDAEDIRGEVGGGYYALAGNDLTRRGSYLRDIAREARTAVGLHLCALGVTNTMTLNSPTPPPGGHGDQQQQQQGVGRVAVHSEVNVAEAREICGFALPWTIWQWARRWTAVGRYFGQMDRQERQWFMLHGGNTGEMMTSTLVGVGEQHSHLSTTAQSLPPGLSSPWAAPMSSLNPALMGDNSSNSEDELFGSFDHAGNWIDEAALSTANVPSKTVWLPELNFVPAPGFLLGPQCRS